MIRVLLGSALSILGLGLSAAFVAPSLVGAPSGEPMLVAEAGSASFQPASFQAAACAEAQLLAGRHGSPSEPGLRVVALGFVSGAHGVRVILQDVPDGAIVPDETVLLVLDASGRVLATGSAASLAEGRSIAAVDPDCAPLPKAPPPGNI
jgi:hypothetical protein